MKKVLTVLLVLSCYLSFGQKIFVTRYESEADIKVYWVNYESQADLKVYKTLAMCEATGNDGIWMIVDSKGMADKTIFFVNSHTKADLCIYYINDHQKDGGKSKAGWVNMSKKYLLR